MLEDRELSQEYEERNIQTRKAKLLRMWARTLDWDRRILKAHPATMNIDFPSFTRLISPYL